MNEMNKDRLAALAIVFVMIIALVVLMVVH